MAFKNAMHLAFEPTTVRLAYCSPKRAILGCIFVLLTNKFTLVLGFSKWLKSFTLPSLKRTVLTGEVLADLLTGDWCSFTADAGVLDLAGFFTVLLVVAAAVGTALDLALIGFDFSA